MNTVLFIDTNKNNEERQDIKACSNNSIMVSIWTKTTEDAIQRFTELQPDIIKAAEDWKPEPPKEEPKPEEKSEEEIQEAIKEIDHFYNQNKAMKMIGKSTLWTYVAPGGEAHEDFEDVLNACMNSKGVDFREMFIVLFALGFIWGQRKERQRRRGIK